MRVVRASGRGSRCSEPACRSEHADVIAIDVVVVCHHHGGGAIARVDRGRELVGVADQFAVADEPVACRDACVALAQIVTIPAERACELDDRNRIVPGAEHEQPRRRQDHLDEHVGGAIRARTRLAAIERGPRIRDRRHAQAKLRHRSAPRPRTTHYVRRRATSGSRDTRRSTHLRGDRQLSTAQRARGDRTARNSGALEHDLDDAVAPEPERRANLVVVGLGEDHPSRTSRQSARHRVNAQPLREISPSGSHAATARTRDPAMAGE